MGIQVITQRASSVPDTGAVRYAHLGGSASHNADEDIGGAQLWSASGTLRNLVVTIGTAPGSGKSWTYVVRINGVDSSLSVTIADSDTTGRDTSNSVSVSAGDRVTLKVTPSGTPALSSVNDQYAVEFDSDTAGESAYGRSRAAIVSAATEVFIPAFASGSPNSWFTTETHAADVVPLEGDITRLDFGFGNATAGGGEASIYLNGVKQDGTGGTVDTRVTIATTVSRVNDDATFTLPITAGDRVSIAIAKHTSDWPAVWVGLCVTADTDGQSIFAGGGAAPSDSSTVYDHAGYGSLGVGGWTGTESQITAQGGVTTFGLSGFRAVLVTAPGSGKSFTLDLREGSASPSGTPEITLADSDVDGEDPSGSLSVSDGDLIDMRSVPSGTPTTSIARWAFIQTVANTIRGSTVFGEGGTIAGLSRVHLLNMDGTTRTLSDADLEGSVYLGGNLTIEESATAPVAHANTARIYAEDNGSGKTRLMVQFGSGAAQQIAIEP